MIKIFTSLCELFDFIQRKIGLTEKGKWHARWTVYKYRGEALPENLYATEVIENNLLLTGGITELWKLFSGDPTATPFNQANSYLGVGDSNTAAEASQTGLQASTNKTYKQVSSGYPQISGATISYIAQFGTDEANFAWNEFSLRNASSESSGTAANRKVQDKGTKDSGDTWILRLDLSLS